MEPGSAPTRYTLEWVSNPLFVFLMDSGFRVVHATPSFQQFLGYPPDGIVGKQLREFLDSKNQLNLRVLGQTETGVRELIHGQQLAMMTHGSGMKVVELQAATIKGDGTTCVIGCDVTKQFQLNQQIRDNLERLEQLHQLLSKREQVVLDQVVQGKLNKSIAANLEVTVRAVERIRARLRTKFQANSSAEMIKKATEYNLLRGLVNQIDESQESR